MRPKDPVLVALDDDEDIVALVAAIAGSTGFAAQGVTTADKFRELVAERRPDVIVLDLQMPKADGVSMLRALADMKVQAAILLVTGMDVRTIASAEQYGLSRGLKVVGTLQKPFEPDDLANQL